MAVEPVRNSGSITRWRRWGLSVLETFGRHPIWWSGVGANDFRHMSQGEEQEHPPKRDRHQGDRAKGNNGR